MAQTKIAAYLGLARRAGKLTLGVNAVAALRGGVYLLVSDEDASENTKHEIQKLKRKLGCPCVEISALGQAVGKEPCRLAAVREEHLAAAIAAEVPCIME